VSELHWSPAGHNIILAGLAGTQGALEFFNVDDMSTLRLQQHFMCNNVKWDQTGRYACSWVDAHREIDHGYVVWSFTGDMLYRCGPAHFHFHFHFHLFFLFSSYFFELF
jgi:translation initiation factor 3 subunit B